MSTATPSVVAPNGCFSTCALDTARAADAVATYKTSTKLIEIRKRISFQSSNKVISKPDKRRSTTGRIEYKLRLAGPVNGNLKVVLYTPVINNPLLTAADLNARR